MEEHDSGKPWRQAAQGGVPAVLDSKEKVEEGPEEGWEIKGKKRREISLLWQGLCRFFQRRCQRVRLRLERVRSFWLARKMRHKHIFYIGGADVLPAPLSAEEEKDYVARLEQGDQQAKSVLIERNLRLVVYIARKFENAGVNVEDLISIGSIGLIKAVNTFDPGKNIKLATYASRCIENEILMFLRRNQKTRGDVSFDEPLNVDMDGNELLLSDILGTEHDVVYSGLEEEINKKLLMQAMSRLTQRERQIVEMRFGLGGEEEMTQKEVADVLGISQSYISRLEKKIMGKLQREIRRLV